LDLRKRKIEDTGEGSTETIIIYTFCQIGLLIGRSGHSETCSMHKELRTHKILLLFRKPEGEKKTTWEIKT
jgi:hypothetical protein